MKIATKIVLAVGAALAVGYVIAFVAVGIATMNWQTMIDLEYIKQIMIEAGYGEYVSHIDDPEVKEMINMVMTIAGVVLMGFGIPSLINAIIGFVGISDKAKKGNHIGGIVFSVLGINPVTLAGHILGLIAGARAQRAAPALTGEGENAPTPKDF